jgi:hypothetical protein
MRNIKFVLSVLALFFCLSANANSVSVEKNSSSIVALKYNVIQMSSGRSVVSSSGRVFVFPKLIFSRDHSLYYKQIKGALKSGVEITAVKVNLGSSTKWVPVSYSSRNSLVSSHKLACRMLSDKNHPMKVALSTHVGKDHQVHITCVTSHAPKNSTTF